MPTKSDLIETLNNYLGKWDVQIIRKSRLIKLQKHASPTFCRSELPEGAEEYLTWGNPRLLELKEKYSSLELADSRYLGWTDTLVRSSIDLRYFRGDNAYIYQLRDGNREGNYLLTTYYVKNKDYLNLLNLLKESGLFGVHTYKVGDLLVSRDLLDSILEIYFLEKVLNISKIHDLNILDIGAGYGRLAQRFANGLPNLERVICADAIPESTFLCEYYLRFCGLAEKAKAVPLYDLESALPGKRIQLATNVCSFSECNAAWVEWWIDLINKHEIQYLFIEPDSLDNGGSKLLTRDRNGYREFESIITERGYRLKAKEPKFLDPFMQEYGLSPTFYYLFEKV